MNKDSKQVEVVRTASADQMPTSEKVSPSLLVIEKNKISGEPWAALIAYFLKSITIIGIIWLIAHYGLPAAVTTAIGKLVEHFIR